jgi:hypothetical protein
MIKSMCAWCGKVLREGLEPVTHGTCRACELEIYEKNKSITPDEKAELARLRGEKGNE